MMWRQARVALSLAFAAPLATTYAQARQLELLSCRISGVEQQARCGTYSVPENRTTRRGRMLVLRVVLLPPTGPQPAPDPIVPLPGGPGGSVIRAAAAWARILAPARVTRAILLVDPRGTGDSGALDCELTASKGNLSAYFRDFLPVDRVKACRADLEKRADLSTYTTETIADDLDEVRAALGIATLNLYGLSGGTRQAQIFLRRHPERVRSMVLGGVVTPEFRVPLTYARDGQQAFDALAADCGADAACQRAYPTLREDLRDVLRRLTDTPARLPLEQSNGAADTATITRDVFAEQIRVLLYSPATAAYLPLIITRAARGDFAPFAETIVPRRQPPPPDGISMGHFLSITCSEDTPRISDRDARRETTGTFLGDYRIRQQKAACALWPRGTLSADHFERSTSNVPTLFISGDADPVTPPRWAEDAARYLPNSASIVFGGGGHVPFNTACAIRIASDFIASGSPRGLSTACVRDFRRPPFRLQ